MLMFTGWNRITAAIGLGLALAAAPSVAPAQAPAANQATADAVANVLRSSPALRGNRIEIQAREGLVTLAGTVGSRAQKIEAIARATRVGGVRGVVDQLRVGDPTIQTAQYQVPQYQVAMGHHRQMAAGGGAPMMMGDGMVMDGGTTMTAPSNAPTPEGPAGSMGFNQSATPNRPNYAWPSYAPYPNFSAVGYPTAYPWQAFPNIGPFYPYPEVPLDWRAVTLRWDDGIWWLDFKKHYTRPFFTPYPFGLFAY
ncbi:MAG TPA: BON domain-containing protein [Isosphaeraceae bacterium]|jgi:hypothetical protein|nr:BON domain-containing protein [Isosphaeraceae bacterium]